MTEPTPRKTRVRRKDEEAQEPASGPVEVDVPLSRVPRMRRFYMMRLEDESGVSGVGIILEGIEFSNGKAAITWHSHMGVVGVYDSVKVVQSIHGHEGKTKIVWIDPEEQES